MIKLINQINRGCHSFIRISCIESKNVGDVLNVQGWIENIRRMKNIIFVDISDGSSNKKLQITLSKNYSNKSVQIGSTIRAQGKLQLTPSGDYEIQTENIVVLGAQSEGFPFTPKQDHSLEYVRKYLHLRCRISYFASIYRIRHKAVKAIHDFMDINGFINVQTPILTTNDCEGAGEVFVVRPDSDKLLKEMSRTEVPIDQSYFGKKVYLSVSGQLHLESMSYGLGNTYTFSPAFRAENSKSPLHLSEFYMLEAELAFVDKLQNLTNFIENLIKTITLRVIENSSNEIAYLGKHNKSRDTNFDWLDKHWTILSFNDALNIILGNQNNFKTKVRPSNGFSKEQELYLVTYCKGPVFIVNWPREQKPFYMKLAADETKVEAIDLLMPTVGELCGGSLRELDTKRILDGCKLQTDLQWYLDLRKFGGVPTGGFGLGFERYLQLITNVKNIRDVIPFPRYPHSCRM